MQVETKKSKVSRPQQKAKAFIASEHELADGTEINGFNPDYIIIREAINLKIIESRGAWKVYVTDNGEELKCMRKTGIHTLSIIKIQKLSKRLLLRYITNYSLKSIHHLKILSLK
nr:UvsX-like recombinase [Staphylococcus phage S-CoN_Ph38]